MTTPLVLEGAASRRRRFISFFVATSLVVCGTSFISGLIFLSYLLIRLLIIFIILVNWRVYRDLLTLISGMLLFGSKERNNRIFKHKVHELVKLLDYVKFTSFLWLKAKLLTTAFSYTDGWRHHLLCIGVREYFSSGFFIRCVLCQQTLNVVFLLSDSLPHTLCELNHSY